MLRAGPFPGSGDDGAQDGEASAPLHHAPESAPGLVAGEERLCAGLEVQGPPSARSGSRKARLQPSRRLGRLMQ